MANSLVDGFCGHGMRATSCHFVFRGFWEAVFFHGAEILVLMVHGLENPPHGVFSVSLSAQRSLDVFCEKEITQTFVDNSESGIASSRGL